MPEVSAVISTYQRPDACERALLSVLEQDPPPVEALICDDGSTDDTPARFRAWETRDPRVRYLRVEPNRGTPGAARNLGTREARGDWVGYLDDDDAWLPGKLERQLALTASADVVATNAMRADGGRYFPNAAEVWRPTRAALLAENPLIVSTVIVPRQLILAAGGFTAERWARGVADYEMWLALADHGARFAIVGEPLVLYETHGSDRMSATPVYGALAVTRLAWRRLRANPRDPLLRRAALNRTAGALSTALGVARARRS